MKEKIQNLVIRLIKNQLIKGTTTLFLGGLVGNFANYLYHLLMGRMLGPSDYGALASVVSLLYIFGIPLGGLNLAVVRRVSNLRGKKQKRKIVSFYHYLNRKIFWVGLYGGVLISLFSPLIKHFLHLDSVLPILMMVGCSFVGIFVGINLSVLNAFLKFIQVSLIGIFQALTKLAAAILLVALGLSVFGASSSFLIGSLIAFVFSFFSLRKVLTKNGQDRDKSELGSIIKEMAPFFISTLAFASLCTTDVVLARHFLPAEEAGFYSALATLGKIIFFACGPIVSVMFPIVSARHAAGEDHRRLFFLSLFLVFLICFGVTGIYFLFCQLMVKILFGSEYLAAAKYLSLFGLFLSFYSLSSLVAQFFLSISQNKIVVFPFLAALAQVVLIIFFHQGINQIAWVSTMICALLFVSLMLYYFVNYAKEKI